MRPYRAATARTALSGQRCAAGPGAQPPPPPAPAPWASLRISERWPQRAAKPARCPIARSDPSRAHTPYLDTFCFAKAHAPRGACASSRRNSDRPWERCGGQLYKAPSGGRDRGVADERPRSPEREGGPRSETSAPNIRRSELGFGRPILRASRMDCTTDAMK